MKSTFKIKPFTFYLWVGLAYFLLGTLHTSSNYPDKVFFVILNNLWAVLYVTAVTYLLFEYSIPFVLRKRKAVIYNILLGILLLWVHLMLYSYGGYAWRLLGIQLDVYTALKVFLDVEYILENQMGYSMGAVCVFGVTRAIYQYVKLRQAAQQLRIEKQQAELNYLRSQTNPHFLFNTLNNIYSLARDKSDIAPESILRLSKILRFMLYETGGKYVSIEQELKIISDYIALEKLRYDESLRINFNYDVEDLKQSITPLLLIPLVENAFKHGASETRNQPFVDIHLSVNNRQLTFIVKNSVEAFTDDAIVKENIGLSNLRRQLELLYKQYDLSVLKSGVVFTATLKINLSSHV